MLLVFKYAAFFSEIARGIGSRLGAAWEIPSLRIALPVGLSFFTFKTISYIADMFYRKQPAERNIAAVATYISFFPQILAGPIERGGRFIPQLSEKVTFDYSRTVEGLRTILWGLFKKAVIADRLALLVNQVYDKPMDFSGTSLIIATYLFAFQIYCDFSGYSDMAVGTAKILGFSTMTNFERPYHARSIADFWRRWHISLSTWFRDYLYIPLGGSRVASWTWARNVLLVFLISGLWHGSAWTFIVWGGLHGIYLIAGRAALPLRTRLAKALGLNNHPVLMQGLRIIATFHLVTFAWIFFRAESITHAVYIITHLFQGLSFNLAIAFHNFRTADLIIAVVLIAIMEAVHVVQSGGNGMAWLFQRPVWLRWALYAAAVLAIINLRPLYQAPFIYLQF
jgi:D-alanyl-lipoteichoic acid acyltransferase DltB (MBOAT superfamily)